MRLENDTVNAPVKLKRGRPKNKKIFNLIFV